MVIIVNQVTSAILTGTGHGASSLSTDPTVFGNILMGQVNDLHVGVRNSIAWLFHRMYSFEKNLASSIHPSIHLHEIYSSVPFVNPSSIHVSNYRSKHSSIHP
jgi:hypothetical protein